MKKSHNSRRVSKPKDDGQEEVHIYMLKLTSGESIIAKIEASDEIQLIVKEPVLMDSFTYATSEGISSSLYFSEWFTDSVSSAFRIPKSSVVSAGLPSRQIIRRYIETLVKTALQKPSPKRQVAEDDDEDEGESPYANRWGFQPS